MTFLPDDTANMMMFPGSPLNVHGSDTFDFCDVSGDDDHNNATKLLSSPPTIKNSSSSLCDQVAAIAANAPQIFTIIITSYPHRDYPWEIV